MSSHEELTLNRSSKNMHLFVVACGYFRWQLWWTLTCRWMSMEKQTARPICTGLAGREDSERFTNFSFFTFSSILHFLFSAWSGNQPGGRTQVDGCAEGDREALWERHCQAWRWRCRRNWKAEPGLSVPSTTSLFCFQFYICEECCALCTLKRYFHTR